ncbi:hypothetical protein EWM64_g92 [Hericium alpestre]|uniref:FAD-binding domain-containing protein n=1 Tax=Hericium alpestre TaxID=135208 RepID=A0A4Z0AA20_9AGAM|nr:hypothetical protein EWM64_g92 [Hericium alpestre]
MTMPGFHEARAPSIPKKATLAIDFLIVGAGIAGLSCAVALRRVGHRVTVVEKEPSIDGSQYHAGGSRMPPNMTKVFYHWGMGDKIMEPGVISERVVMQQYRSGTMLGSHRWDKEMLEEAGGEFVFIHHAKLRRILYETALELGATIRFRSKVVEVSEDSRSVTLSSGEELRADVVIGADGVHGPCRLAVDEEADSGRPSGLMMFNAIIPGESMRTDPDLAPLLDGEFISLWVWFGENHCALCFPIAKSDDCAFYFYAPDEGNAQDVWNDMVSAKEVSDHATVSDAERRLKKLARLARQPSRIRCTEWPDLDDWVHESGRLVVVGEAAHPFPPGSIQGSSMSLEDASTLAKLFSHLISYDQIESFLYAFQELRQGRVKKNRITDMANIYFMTMSGEESRQRDKAMLAMQSKGQNVLGGDDGNKQQWDENRDTFDYDAEDEADNWWVQWGLLRERAKASSTLANASSGVLAFPIITTESSPVP